MPGQFSFPSGERLTRRSDFLRVYSDGAKRVGSEFICYVARREGQGRKVGFAVSRKVGGAVVRNRIKRYLREIYRTGRPEWCDNIHVVVVARPACVNLGYRRCRDAVRTLLLQGGAMRG